MKTPIKLQWVAGVAAMVASLSAQAYPGESIVLDPVTGNYTITYRSSDENITDLMQTVFVPATRIEPAIRSSFHSREGEAITYRYTVTNGATAKQAIIGVWLDGMGTVVDELPLPRRQNATQATVDAYIAAEKSALSTPPNWNGSIIRSMSRVAWNPSASLIRTGGIQAGRTVSGFGFASLDLPGISLSKLRGIDKVGGGFGYADEGPAENSAILAELEWLQDNDFVPRNAAVPTIAVPTPFDPAVTLERIQTHMHTWIGMQLPDATFSAQLDRSFQSAISAYRLNQPKVGKQHIQTMRALIKKEHADADREDDNDERGEQGDHDDKNKAKRALIDKLAARVLDFDLKYVTKRMGNM